MEKEFIPYEQALALKELGFDEPCIAQWDEKELFPLQQGGELPYFEVNKNPNLSFNITAPLYQQAFRWFREKYNLKGYVSPVEYLDGTAETYHWCVYDKCNSGNDQLAYKEAELECLKKLISIVKEK